ncbi:MAG: type I restriction-modification enzyme R subunit C-terminal domain-containing protein [Blastocatellia bacterium]
MNESEWLTRKRRIDSKLRSLNPAWEIVRYREGLDFSKLTCHAIEELPTANGPADYALFVKGKLLGIIEAKKVTVNPQNVLEQAKRYAKGIFQGSGNWDGYYAPFLYATNGEIIWHLDVRNEKKTSRKISNFHTAMALESFFTTDLKPARNWLINNSSERIERIRDYQKDAIKEIEKNIIDGKRNLLVAMATGTGKTYMTVAQVYRLLESKLARRILFLVDRKSLAAQAVREFSSFNTPRGNKFNQEYEVYSQRFRREDFEDDAPFDPKLLPDEYLTNPKNSQTFVYVSTIHRMVINIFGRQGSFAQREGDAEYEEDADKLDIPIHAFDVIIADECHRGYTIKEESIWRDTINHFDAIRIGLTATPAAHTVSIFGDPVFRYGVERAIAEGYLVDYEPVIINSEIRMNGVFLREGETVGKIDPVTGEEVFDELEDERAFSSEEVEQKITAPDSNKRIIEEIAKYAYAHEEETGHFPKTLIFAVNDVAHTSHADQLVRICREVFNQGDDFVQKITGNQNVDRPLQRIREFRNRPNPKIVVTVDMLSTGVDIPALEFIVFLRPVKSRILWEQMLGRGTRLCSGINKTHFTIFDCFDGTLIKYFKDVSNFKIEPPRKEPTPLPQVIENIYNNVEQSYHVGLLVKRLRRIEKNMTGKAREEFSRFIADGDMGKFAGNLPASIKNDFTQTLKLLRNSEFQALLLNYERARDKFTVAYEAQDVVTSQRIARFGNYEKPEDYLEAFSSFVKDNSDKIAALKILLERPKQWRPQVLEELQKKLKENNYTEKKLREAHGLVYDKALADIISMVKHAAKAEEPILTAEERVNRAMDKITQNKSFNEDQQKWLGLIREHLMQGLSIDEEDFDLIPIFSNRGGKGRARKVFGAQLSTLIEELNQGIAA